MRLTAPALARPYGSSRMLFCLVGFRFWPAGPLHHTASVVQVVRRPLSPSSPTGTGSARPWCDASRSLATRRGIRRFRICRVTS